MYVGTRGALLNGRLVPESRMKSYARPQETLPRSIGHYTEWLAACRGGQPAGSEFGFAGLVTQAVLLGNVALRTGKRLAKKTTEIAIQFKNPALQLFQQCHRGRIFETSQSDPPDDIRSS